jgi:hypothetical protein
MVAKLNIEIILLIINAATTWFMTGLIWFVQIVHYPLFDSVGAHEFQAYAERHRHLTSLVVVIPMITEICTALLLAILWKRSDSWLLWLCFALVVGIWISTVCCSIPCHAKLCSTGYSATTHNWLVLSNWLRTLLWTTRSIALAWLIYKLLADPVKS